MGGNVRRDDLCESFLPYSAEEQAKFDADDRQFIDTQCKNKNLLCPPPLHHPYERRFDCSLFPSDGFKPAWDNRLEAAKDILWPPIVMFLVGYILLWILRGFRHEG